MSYVKWIQKEINKPEYKEFREKVREMQGVGGKPCSFDRQREIQERNHNA